MVKIDDSNNNNYYWYIYYFKWIIFFVVIIIIIIIIFVKCINSHRAITGHLQLVSSSMINDKLLHQLRHAITFLASDAMQMAHYKLTITIIIIIIFYSDSLNDWT